MRKTIWMKILSKLSHFQKDSDSTFVVRLNDREAKFVDYREARMSVKNRKRGSEKKPGQKAS